MTARAALLAGLVLLGGCSLEPKYVRPTPAVPAQLPSGGAYPAQAAEAPPPAINYRDVFRDPNLQAIIAQALANNQDLRIAASNVEVARGQYRVQRAQILPEIGATGRAAAVNQTRTGTTTATGGGGTGANAGNTSGVDPITGQPTGTGTGGTTTTTTRSTTTTYVANIGLTSFEIDLFGRLRSLSRAALQDYLASEEAQRAVRLTLVAETASAYLTLAADRSLLAIAIDTENVAKRSVDLTRYRLEGGVAPRTDLRQAETVLLQARSDRADLTTAVAQDRNALELLAGGPIADNALPVSIESVDGLLAEVPAGLDSRILLRRPDVAQAEYTLRGANARIGAARAAFFPTISLTALAGVASTALNSLVSGTAFNWSVTPQIGLPLFDGGERRGNLAIARAVRERAVGTYQRAIQIAFREVADALARRGTIDLQYSARADLEAAARDTAALEEARYRQGITPYLNALDAQRTLYTARRNLTSTRLVRADNLVTLFRTLGGDTEQAGATAGAGASGH